MDARPRSLPPHPKGLLPSSVCRHDGDVYLAEYALRDEPGRIHVSDDDGRTWSVLFEHDAVRHFHGVYTDPYGESLWASTGDRDEESSVGIVANGEYQPVGSGSQAWCGVQLGFTPDAVFWGKDASFAEEKPIYKLPRERLSEPNPDPDVVGPTDSASSTSRRSSTRANTTSSGRRVRRPGSTARPRRISGETPVHARCASSPLRARTATSRGANSSASSADAPSGTRSRGYRRRTRTRSSASTRS